MVIVDNLGWNCDATYNLVIRYNLVWDRLQLINREAVYEKRKLLILFLQQNLMIPRFYLRLFHGTVDSDLPLKINNGVDDFPMDKTLTIYISCSSHANGI
jgi:hypothetical protein